MAGISIMKLNIFLLNVLNVLYFEAKSATLPVSKKDLSEYCKRRVMPSIFLGKQVKDANLNVLRFSRLELPYSCMISVRTESGNNMILVLNTEPDDRLKVHCERNRDVFVVYELGETFGGYWGPLPKSVLNPKPDNNNDTKFYTIKTTPSTTQTTSSPTTESSTGYEDYSNVALTGHHETDPDDEKKEGDYIRIEVPLVNVSGYFQLQPHSPNSYNHMFDNVYDVLPRKGVSYRTSLLPLLQFSIKEEGNDKNDVPRYGLEYKIGNGFTLDPRLLYSTNKKWRTLKRNWFANRRLNNMGRKKHLPSIRNTPINFNKFFTTVFKSDEQVLNRTQATSTLPTIDNEFLNTLFNESFTKSWNVIEKLLESYNITTTKRKDSPSVLIEEMDDVDRQNISAYLYPNWQRSYESSNYKIQDSFKQNYKEYSNFITEKMSSTLLSSGSSTEIPKVSIPLSLEFKVTEINPNITESIYTVVPQKATLRSHINTNNHQSLNSEIVNKSLKYESKTESHFNLTSTKHSLNQETDSSSPTSPHHETSSATWTQSIKPTEEFGSMVNRESWENVVIAAPVMASALNITEITNNTKSRIKRYNIEPLDIEKSRPRMLTTKVLFTKYDDESDLLDMQDLVHLIELDDDELQGRLALRYIRNYVGPVMYNICDFEQTRSRKVHLLNSSRVVIAVTNFTLLSMTIVMTPAVTLLNQEVACPTDHSECQILGTRVCIDDVNSCDGIPNCGTNDIYDEDRALCGSNSFIQYIFLTAFTFTAVILLVFYTVHYWLRRCVPKVSKAFFIYTDTSENTLNLDSIMKSPKDDTSDNKDDNRQYGDYDADFVFDDIHKIKAERSLLKTIFGKCCICLRSKDSRKIEDELKDKEKSANTRPVFSFTQLELIKMAKNTVEENTQTETFIDNNKKEAVCSPRCKNIQDEECCVDDKNANKTTNSKRRYVEELNLLRLSNERLLFHDQTKNVEKTPLPKVCEEIELECTVYEKETKAAVPEDDIEVHKTKDSEITSVDKQDKHLRFDTNQPTMIPRNDQEEGISDIEEVPSFSGKIMRRNSKDGSHSRIQSTGKKSKKTSKLVPR